MSDGKKIQLDAYKEIKNADRLDEIAKKLNESARRIEQSKCDLSKKWQGTAASEYIAKMNQMEESIRMRSREIRKTSALLHFIVEKTRQAEARAEEIAQTREYK